MIINSTDTLAHISAQYPFTSAIATASEDAIGDSDGMAVLTIIASDGVICRCNRLAGVLLNCLPSLIVWQNISMVLPQLKQLELMQADRVHPYLRFLSRIEHHFEVLAMNGKRFTSKLYFNEVEDLGQHCLRLILRPVL
jgi:hypothetical protein